MPPAYSAKKDCWNSRYKLAREGKPVELKAVTIHIHHFEIVSLDGAEAAFTMTSAQGATCGLWLTNWARTSLRSAPEQPAAHSGRGLHAQRGALARRTATAGRKRESPGAVVCASAQSVAGDAFCNWRCDDIGRLRNGAQANLPEFSQAPLVKVFDGQRELVGLPGA